METARDITRVLVVDDEESQRTALASMIKLWGYSVETASDGQEALEKQAEFNAHVVVTDLNMPRMNGQELFKAPSGRRKFAARHCADGLREPGNRGRHGA